MTKQALPWLRGLGSLCCSAMGTGPARGENKRKKQSPKGLERGQNSSLYTGNQPKALWLQAGWAFASLITGTCEIPNTTFNCGSSCAILATASAGWQPHRQSCCWECQGEGTARAGHDAPAKPLLPLCLPPLTQGGAGARQGSVSGSKRGAKGQPNLKVMEDSQDQREGMNFKHVLLCFGKAETLK